MKYHHLVLLCFGLISIFHFRTAYSEGKVTIYTSHQADPEVIHFTAKNSVELNCNSTESGDISWEKGGKPVTEVLKERAVVSGQNNNTLTLKDMEDSDFGNYSCIVTAGTSKYTDTVALAQENTSRWGVQVSKSVNVVEGEKMSLKCQVRGNLTLQWWYLNTTNGGITNYTQLPGTDPRVTIGSYIDETDKGKPNITNGELKIKDVQMWDRGEYLCIGESDDGSVRFNATCTIRIKGKYAALWPFLGICAEVFVLCAIIFIYEKKRNKTELEESDTDQSPDQKNTPDHGKESNLRHRQ